MCTRARTCIFIRLRIAKTENARDRDRVRSSGRRGADNKTEPGGGPTTTTALCQHGNRLKTRRSINTSRPPLPARHAVATARTSFRHLFSFGRFFFSSRVVRYPPPPHPPTITPRTNQDPAIPSGSVTHVCRTANCRRKRKRKRNGRETRVWTCNRQNTGGDRERASCQQRESYTRTASWTKTDENTTGTGIRRAARQLSLICPGRRATIANETSTRSNAVERDALAERKKRSSAVDTGIETDETCVDTSVSTRKR